MRVAGSRLQSQRLITAITSMISLWLCQSSVANRPRRLHFSPPLPVLSCGGRMLCERWWLWPRTNTGVSPLYPLPAQLRARVSLCAINTLSVERLDCSDMSSQLHVWASVSYCITEVHACSASHAFPSSHPCIAMPSVLKVFNTIRHIRHFKDCANAAFKMLM